MSVELTMPSSQVQCVRAALFFGLACPVFALLGGYLGWISTIAWRRELRGWAGVVLGTVGCFGAVGARNTSAPTFDGLATGWHARVGSHLTRPRACGCRQL